MNTDTVRHNPANETLQKVNSMMPQRMMNLKQQINSLLWEQLKGSTTLDEAEKIACDMIMLMVDRLNDDQE